MDEQMQQRKQSEAKIVYGTICSALDNRKWHYNKEEDNLIIRTSVRGEDLSMNLYIKVDADRSVMYLKSAMPFETPRNRIDDMMRMVTIANWAMLNGMFEMDINDGYVGFKMVAPFMQSIISEKLCNYMIDLSCRMIDKFNDKFLAVLQDKMTMEQFVEFTKKAFN